MAPTPSWVKKLTPSDPQGSDLLIQERSKSNLDVDRLATFLFTNEVLQRQAKILKVLQADKVFDKSQNYFDGRVDRFKTALARAKRLAQLNVRNKWTKEEFMTANELISEPGPYGLHATMFLITLRDQGTPEQHKLFLEKAEKYEIIGCYAQTELGHGSNVRGLETTATWNQDDNTFTIHSPHLTASKWWIGSLGRTANHAVVMAQLVIGGKSYGPHPFVVQIRDMKTHEPLEGIHVGDIGPKFGYNTMDNGFLLLNHVKIPHVNMLAKFSGVDPKSNKYIRPASASLVYGTLTWVRSTIVLQSGGVLARGVTIATRYAAVRRQFQDRDAKESETGENQVLNYTMVQIRLLPLLAATFALHFTGRGMMELYQQNQKKMTGDAGKTSSTNRGAGPEELHPGTDLLADLHATSCGLKALASTTAAEGLELLKSARAVLKGNPPANDTANILQNFLARRDMGAAFDVLGRDEDIVAAFAWRTAFLTFEALKHRDEEKNSWNSLLVDFWRLSTAHSQYLIVKNFHDALKGDAIQSELDPDTIALLQKLFRLYALNTLEREASEFFSSSAVTVRQIQLARTKTVMKLLEEIRPHAVRLVDAWKFSDWQLDSSLGRYDGKVYEDLFHRASELNPLNALTIDPYPNSEVLVKKDERVKFGPKL
ncbi:fatty-acyl coenzyme A oxidase [Xylographa bjoerkii]|nr:fatty-acyl coenzyme A oxidase [Xylographa bjoerkii]